MQSHTRSGMFFIVGVILAVSLLGLMTACTRKEAPRPMPEVGVMVVQPGRAVLNSELPGRVSAYLVAEIHPQVSGIVQKRCFTEGSDVEEGSLLYH